MRGCTSKGIANHEQACHGVEEPWRGKRLVVAVPQHYCMHVTRRQRRKLSRIRTESQAIETTKSERLMEEPRHGPVLRARSLIETHRLSNCNPESRKTRWQVPGTLLRVLRDVQTPRKSLGKSRPQLPYYRVLEALALKRRFLYVSAHVVVESYKVVKERQRTILLVIRRTA